MLFVNQDSSGLAEALLQAKACYTLPSQVDILISWQRAESEESEPNTWSHWKFLSKIGVYHVHLHYFGQNESYSQTQSQWSCQRRKKWKIKDNAFYLICYFCSLVTSNTVILCGRYIRGLGGWVGFLVREQPLVDREKCNFLNRWGKKICLVMVFAFPENFISTTLTLFFF